MKKSKFAITMHCAAAISCILTVLFVVLYRAKHYDALLSLAITFGTTFYHFAMRLLVGALVPRRFDYRKGWFRPAKWEPALYKAMRLKKWKAELPTYNPRLFSIQENSLEQILCNMCQAEVVHEVIILLSFLPIAFSSVFNGFVEFLITSVLAAGFDLLFVMLQRFNRPRIEKLMHLQNRRNGQ